MNGTLRRETFIALRARREGYRIASDILNPPVPMPQVLARDPSDVRHVDDWANWPSPAPPPRAPIPKLKVAILIIVDAAIIASWYWLIR